MSFFRKLRALFNRDQASKFAAAPRGPGPGPGPSASASASESRAGLPLHVSAALARRWRILDVLASVRASLAAYVETLEGIRPPQHAADHDHHDHPGALLREQLRRRIEPGEGGWTGPRRAAEIDLGEELDLLERVHGEVRDAHRAFTDMSVAGDFLALPDFVHGWFLGNEEMIASDMEAILRLVGTVEERYVCFWKAAEG